MTTRIVAALLACAALSLLIPATPAAASSPSRALACGPVIVRVDAGTHAVNADHSQHDDRLSAARSLTGRGDCEDDDGNDDDDDKLTEWEASPSPPRTRPAHYTSHDVVASRHLAYDTSSVRAPPQ